MNIVIRSYHLTLALVVAIAGVFYLREVGAVYSTGGWLGTVGHMMVFPHFLIVVAIYAAGIVCFVFLLPIRIAMELAEDLVDCGWPYWLAVTCSIPVGLLGMVVMFATLL